MLIIYWLAVVFHLSLAGQVVVRDEVETTTTTTTTTTTRQSSPEPMPPMDPKTRFYHQFGSAPGGGFQSWELYMVLNNRKTWYEARKHCQHNELDLVFMDTIGMVTILSIFRELTKKEDLPQNEVLWHGVPKGWNTPKSRCPVMAMRYDLNLFFDRKCNQTTGKDEYGHILVGYFCGREISEAEYISGIRSEWD